MSKRMRRFHRLVSMATGITMWFRPRRRAAVQA